MWRKMQGKEEPKVWEQGFKACNTHVEMDRMKLNTFLWFLMLFLVFLLCFVATSTIFNSIFHCVDIVSMQM
jgi:hypothetical protein